MTLMKNIRVMKKNNVLKANSNTTRENIIYYDQVENKIFKLQLCNIIGIDIKQLYF